MVDSPYPPVERQPRLVLRFALYTGAVLLAAGVAIAWLVNREVANRAERTVEQQAAETPLVDPERLRTPPTVDR